jgi:hypothetical protein
MNLGVKRIKNMPRIIVPGRVLLPVIILAAVLGCASAPVQEMSDARQAIAAAEDAGAAQRAPEALVAARQSLSDAEASLQTHSFGLARTHALSAKNKAVEALAASQGADTDP